MRANTTNGFSLIELLVTLAVLATLLAIALPSFADILHRIHVTAAAETLYADLQLARAEAIKRNQTIFLVFGNIGRTARIGVTDSTTSATVVTAPARPSVSVPATARSATVPTPSAR